ncbi:MAG TPA: RNA methyltransferase [Cyclobacteriaceae bacterium]|nr:RNA methyltransferase [Cyclobacteriaceae bacterium]
MEEERIKLALIEHFSQYISDQRKLITENVLSQRTRHVTLVLEDIYQAQNASAAVRTCECLGVQDVHVIENENTYEVNKKVVMGSSKWMDVKRYRMKGVNNTASCYHALREAGYKILVTDPSPEGKPIYDVEIGEKIALVMGNELVGISEYALQHADAKVRIPMQGFTESFNISVSAAICLNTLLLKLRQSDVKWQLSDQELIDMRLKWFRKMVRRSDIIEKEFLRSFQ